MLVRPILVRPELMKPLSQILLRWYWQHMFGIGSFACVVVYVPLPTAIRVLVVHDDLLSVSDRGGALVSSRRLGWRLLSPLGVRLGCG